MKQIQIMGWALTIALLAACGQDASTSSAGSQAGSDASAGAENSAAATQAAELAAGDPAAGKRLYIYCQACHSLESGGMNKVGPNLYGVIDGPSAQVEGFAYSQALIDAGLSWDDATLNAWIESPSSLVPGTTMVFAGIRDAQQRADLIAYIRETTGQ